MPTLYGFLAIVMWGTLALLGHYTKGLASFQLLFLCFAIASLLLFGKRFLTKTALFSPPQLTLNDWLIGITGLFGFHFCYFMALKHVSAIEVSLIAYLWPMMLAQLLADRKHRLIALAGSMIAFTGVANLLLQEQSLNLRAEEFTGYLYAFACALIWAVYSYLSVKSTSHVDDIGWLSLAVAMLSLLCHITMESSAWSFELTELITILFLGLGPVGGAFYLWDIGMKQGNAKLLAMLSYCSPLLSSALLASFGLTSWSSSILVALALILLGGLLASKKTT